MRGRGTLAAPMTGIAVRNERGLSNEQRLVELFNEPTHNDNDAITATYLAKNKDPEEVFLSLPGADSKQWVEHLDGWTDEQTGFQIKINETIDNHPNPWQLGNRLSIYMDILDAQGQEIGDFGIHISLKPENKLTMQYGPAELRFSPRLGATNQTDKNMGQGFSTRLVKQIENKGKELGISEANVHAVGIGSYAWTTMGFQFDPRVGSKANIEESLQAQSDDLLESMLMHQEELLAAHPEQAQKVQELENILNNGKRLTLQEISQWGIEKQWIDQDGKRQWIGKKLLLAARSSWQGVKFF